MTEMFEMARRVTRPDLDGEVKSRLEQLEAAANEAIRRGDSTIDKLPDKVLQQIFSYLTPYQILQSGQVCKRWRNVACSPLLWKFVSFRPNYGGIQVSNHDYFLQLIGTQFSELRIVELTTDLITPNVLYEMANKCPRLQHLTLDFSTAMQLHDFTDLQSFPSRLRSLTLCLSENIFLEGFLRKVYTFISSVELLHIIVMCITLGRVGRQCFERIGERKSLLEERKIPMITERQLIWGHPFFYRLLPDSAIPPKP
ncbi:F-box domain protein [Teladorsagia circumcincta]|uniref:F-box domain protein n=1 Tax=Teladorsagia circumcincta TaxID=45464 RepID=A0A2G9V0R9_TELCI|nr:F-box domain protein [Teladorsagia circumcincta]